MKSEENSYVWCDQRYIRNGPILMTSRLSANQDSACQGVAGCVDMPRRLAVTYLNRGTCSTWTMIWN
ncbi:unnamed protein product [Penicillium roqueforti FM164]|uniref:Genomic scaffold, ProqFM164S02 n=1 Tax=Penicillium roqueforti (strain FM164) TaxID=1365484 RepID=W6QQH5_PENRF|nr:unnamed protein product [Penicillium roqueforti FM164]